MIEVFANITIVIMLKYVHVSHQHAAQLKTYTVSIISQITKEKGGELWGQNTKILSCLLAGNLGVLPHPASLSFPINWHGKDGRATHQAVRKFN